MEKLSGMWIYPKIKEKGPLFAKPFSPLPFFISPFFSRGVKPFFFFCSFGVLLLVHGFSTVFFTSVALAETALRPPSSGLFLSIEKSINLALKANRDIKSADFSYQRQKLSLLQTESEFDLKIFPSTEVGVSGGEQDTSEILGTGVRLVKKLETGTVVSVGPSVSKKDGEYDSRASVSFEKPLSRGAGKTFATEGIRQAGHSLRAERRTLYRTKVNIVLNTVHAFYSALQNKSLVTLFDRMVLRLIGHAESARVKERVGVASPIDVFRAEIQLKNAEDSLALAQEAFENSKDRLKTLLTLPLNTRITLSGASEVIPAHLSEQEAIEIALNKRIELEQMEDDLENSVSIVKVARNNTLPELKLSLGYTRFSTSDVFDRSLSLDKKIWSIQFTTSTDLFRKTEKAALEKSLIEYERTQLKSSQIEDSIIQEVRVRLRVLEKARKQIEIRKKQIEQAKGKLELAEVKFNFGMTDNFTMIEAVTELNKGESDLILATINYLVGTYDFRAVLGTLIERT